MKTSSPNPPSRSQLPSGPWGHLIWPLLFRATRLSLRPARMGLAFFMLVLIGVVLNVPSLWLRDHAATGAIAMRASDAAADVGAGLLSLDLSRLLSALGALAFDVPGRLLHDMPWTTLGMLLPIGAIMGILGGAIARTAALEVASYERISWPKALSFAIGRGVSFAGCLLLPLVLTGLLLVVVILLGNLLLRAPGVQVAGALAYPLALLGAGAIVVVLGAFMLGLPMAAPALACEGTDAIDAVQRTIAYAFGKTGRLGMYLALLLVQLILATIVLGAIAHATTSLAAWATTTLLPAEMGGSLRAAADSGIITSSGASSRHATEVVLAFWSRIPGLFVGAFVLSFWFTGGTLLYLTMRHHADAQDPDEIYDDNRTSLALDDAGEAPDGAE